MAIDRCDEEVYEHGESVGLFDMPKEDAERFCQEKSKETGDRYDWHYVSGRVHIKVLRKATAKPVIATADEAVGSWS